MPKDPQKAHATLKAYAKLAHKATLILEQAQKDNWDEFVQMFPELDILMKEFNAIKDSREYYEASELVGRETLLNHLKYLIDTITLSVAKRSVSLHHFLSVTKNTKSVIKAYELAYERLENP